MEEKTLLSVIATVFGIFVIANLLLLNYVVFRVLPNRISLSGPQITEQSTPSPTVIDTCGIACKAYIQSQISEIDTKIATIAAKTPAPTKTAPAVTRATPVPVSGAKEFFIPMGTGSTTKSDWEDVAGSDVYVDTNNFTGIKKVYFEASMHIPTKNGTMYARLYNVTDKHPVWYSDVSTDKETSTFVSSTFTLDPGNKQYRVQLKTTLQYQSLLDNARIKILTQ